MSEAAVRFRLAKRFFLVYFGYTLLPGVLLGGLFWRAATVATAVAAILWIVRTHETGRRRRATA